MTRLAYLTLANGYSSDVGQDIYVGVIPHLGPDDPPAIAITVGDETEVQDDAGRISYTVPVEVIAVIGTVSAISSKTPQWDAEDLLADIKSVVEIEGRDQNTASPAYKSRSLEGTTPTGFTRGACRSYPREGASEIVGASVEYRLSFRDQWGQP